MIVTIPLLIGAAVSVTCYIATGVSSFVTGRLIGKDEAKRKRTP